MEIYETKHYTVKFVKNGQFHRKKFDTEENAVAFGKQKHVQGYRVTIIQERYAINWWL